MIELELCHECNKEIGSTLTKCDTCMYWRIANRRLIDDGKIKNPFLYSDKPLYPNKEMTKIWYTVHSGDDGCANVITFDTEALAILDAERQGELYEDGSWGEPSVGCIVVGHDEMTLLYIDFDNTKESYRADLVKDTEDEKQYTSDGYSKHRIEINQKFLKILDALEN